MNDLLTNPNPIELNYDLTHTHRLVDDQIESASGRKVAEMQAKIDRLTDANQKLVKINQARINQIIFLRGEVERLQPEVLRTTKLENLLDSVGEEAEKAQTECESVKCEYADYIEEMMMRDTKYTHSILWIVLGLLAVLSWTISIVGGAA